MPIEFQRVETSHDRDELVNFLCNEEWPFHGQPTLTGTDVAAMDFASDDVISFWVMDDGAPVGLVRVLDLGDIGAGAPLLDIRIAAQHRARGLGTMATRWTADYLFTTYPPLHRIEANTRHDNLAMKRVLSKAGFTPEGQLRDAWLSNGQFFDTAVYGLLRTDPRN